MENEAVHDLIPAINIMTVHFLVRNETTSPCNGGSQVSSCPLVKVEPDGLIIYLFIFHLTNNFEGYIIELYFVSCQCVNSSLETK